MLGHNASSLIKHIDSSLQFTDVTDSILMPLKTSLITFRSDVGTLDKAEIQEKADLSLQDKKLIGFKCCQSEESEHTLVDVKIMDIRWLFKGGNDFLKFVPILETCKLDKLYQTEFMRSLTNEFWTKNQRLILCGPLVTWLMYSVACLIYFAEVLSRDASPDEEKEFGS